MLTSNPDNPPPGELDDLSFSPSDRLVTCGGVPRRLEPKAARVLEALMNAKGEVLTRQELLDSCWGDGVGSDEALTQAVAQIRKAVGDRAGYRQLLQTVPKRGYRWLGSRTVHAPAQARIHARPSLQTPESARLMVFLVLAVAIIIALIAFMAFGMRREVQIEITRHPPPAAGAPQPHP